MVCSPADLLIPNMSFLRGLLVSANPTAQKMKQLRDDLALLHPRGHFLSTEAFSGCLRFGTSSRCFGRAGSTCVKSYGKGSISLSKDQSGCAEKQGGYLEKHRFECER